MHATKALLTAAQILQLNEKEHILMLDLIDLNVHLCQMLAS